MDKSSSHWLYQRNINRVINHISQNLDRSLSLAELAGIAGFSPYHFSRLFKALMSENLNHFIRRLRLEKAAYLLFYSPQMAITEVAFSCGFSSTQNLAKVFTPRFGKSPREFRRRFLHQPLEKGRNIGNLLGNHGNDDFSLLSYDQCINGEKENLFELELADDRVHPVALENREPVRVAYCREWGTYKPSMVMSALNKIQAWGEGQSWYEPEDSPLMGIFWDNAAITPGDSCRMDGCIVLPDDWEASVETQWVEGGLYAVYSCSVEDNEFYKHWNYLLKTWLPASGYLPDNRPSLEIYRNIGKENKTLQMDICVPLKSL